MGAERGGLAISPPARKPLLRKQYQGSSLDNRRSCTVKPRHDCLSRICLPEYTQRKIYLVDDLSGIEEGIDQGLSASMAGLIDKLSQGLLSKFDGALDKTKLKFRLGFSEYITQTAERCRLTKTLINR